MGIFSNARIIDAVTRSDDVAASPGGARRTRLAYPNPWQTGSLSTLPWSDVFEGYGAQLSRAQAMTIPGVARGRGIILSLIADVALVDYRASERLEQQPTWLYRAPGWQGPWQRMARTLDDHIFYGMSLWGCVRGSASSGLKPIVQAWHISRDDWEFDEAGRICVIDEDGQMMPADEDEVILIPGPSDGLLTIASRTMRGAVDLEHAWISRAKNPIPALDLHETEETNLELEERQEVVDQWAQARLDPNGAIASTPFNIEARVLGSVDPNLFIEARNAARLDIANFFQIPASVMDASTATASLTYVTTEGNQSTLDTMTVPYWIRAIEDRLSQDDIVPVGHVVRFTFREGYTEPSGPIVTSPTQAAEIYTEVTAARQESTDNV